MGLFNLLLKNLLLLLLLTIGANGVRASIEDGNVATKLYLAITVKDGDSIASSENPPPPPPMSPPPSKVAPFKPSIAVIVGVLTIIFSITFLLLLYAKHCKTGRNGYSNRLPPSRQNSGVDRTVIESLPMFRFGSLRGEKDGLECAVCLNRFEPTEVLKLLPKCKHAFHVECVDTWLEGHSTCPLCRYRVDPEDILLVGEDAKILGQNEPLPPPPQGCDEITRRVSGRHSSAGERGARSGGFLKIVLPSESSHHDGGGETTRRSLDSWNARKKKATTSEIVSVDNQPRRDEILLATEEDMTTSTERHRLEHRIIVSAGGESGFNHRWSDAQASDMLYLRSEMIMSYSRRLSGSARPSTARRQREHQDHMLLPLHRNNNTNSDNDERQSGGSVINGRSVSEITGFSRFGNTRRTRSNHHQQQPHHPHHHRWRRQGEEEEEERHAGLVSRWLAWISHSRSQSQTQTQTQTTEPAAVRSEPTNLA